MCEAVLCLELVLQNWDRRIINKIYYYYYIMYGFEALVRRDISKEKPQGDLMALKHYDEPGHADEVSGRVKPQGDLMSLKHYDEPGHADELSRSDRPQGDLMALKIMTSLVMQTRCLEGTGRLETSV